MSKLESNWMYRKIESAKEYQNLAFSSELNERVIVKKKGKVITLEGGQEVVEFCSNAYLGLDEHPNLREAAKDAVDKFGIEVATARTRLVPDLFAEWVSLLNKLFGGHTVIFKSVGPCHLGVYPVLGCGALPSFPISENGVYWIMDRHSHATMQVQQALLKQFGEVSRIDFEDENALLNAFRIAEQKKMTPISISDSIGSMGGVVPVVALNKLAKEFNGYAYLDDAHGTSVFGKNGAGYIHHKFSGKIPERFILVSSLAKAFGAHGGCVTLPTSDDSDVVKRFAVPYAFGGSVSMPSVAAGIASAKLHLSNEITFLQEKLQENLRIFDKHATGSGLEIDNFGSIIPIRGMVIGGEHDCIRIAKKLLDRGSYVVAAAYPTVEKNRALLRVSINTGHTEDQIKGLFYALKEILEFSKMAA